MINVLIDERSLVVMQYHLAGSFVMRCSDDMRSVGSYSTVINGGYFFLF